VHNDIVLWLMLVATLSCLLQLTNGSLLPALHTVSATTGKKSLAMEAFARALRQLPTTIADNAGLDSADIVATLRAAHGADPQSTRMGVDVIAGAAGDMAQLGIFESFKVKNQVRTLMAL
jgi:chaperonin GroEL (HSP60 family)